MTDTTAAIAPDRYQLAEIIDKADNAIQHGIGFGGYDPNGKPLWLADAILESPWLEAHDKALREQIAKDIINRAYDHRDSTGGAYSLGALDYALVANPDHTPDPNNPRRQAPMDPLDTSWP